MRLIDADALISKIEKRYIDANIQVRTRRSGKTVHYGIALGINRARNEIIEQPTIDAEPVLRGQWIAIPSSDMVTGKAYKCSECNKMRYGSYMPNYCQNCGAKMDGGAEDDNP